MRYTPVELRHVKLGRSLRGYKRDEVDRLVEDVADSFEEVWRERGELADKLEDVEQRLDEVKQRETLLASTLVAAEKTAAAEIEAAKRQAEVIVSEAHHESRSIMRAAISERERLFGEVRRIETLLRGALGMVEESSIPAPEAPAEPQADEEQEARPAPWPNREDTREFQAIGPAPEPAKLPPVPEADADDQTDEGPGEARDFAWG